MPKTELPSETLIVANAGVNSGELVVKPSDLNPLRNSHVIIFEGVDKITSDLDLTLSGAGYQLVNERGGIAIAVRDGIDVVSSVNFRLANGGLDGTNKVMVAAGINTTEGNGVKVAAARIDTQKRPYARSKQLKRVAEALKDDYFASDGVILGINDVNPERFSRSNQHILDCASMKIAAVPEYEYRAAHPQRRFLELVGLDSGREALLYRGRISKVTARVVQMKPGIRATETIFTINKNVRQR